MARSALISLGSSPLRTTTYLSAKPVSAFYKGESQGKHFPGDWKERKRSLRFPAHGVLRVSEGFLFFQIHLVIVTALSDSEARQAAGLKCVNHGSI